MYHQAAKKSWPIFFWFYPPKKQFFSGGAQISRNGAVQPNFWKSHSANMKPDCRKYLQAIIVAVQSENDSGWLCFKAMSLKRTCWQRRRTWWRARRSWTRRVEKVILIWRGRCDDGGRRHERQWEFFLRKLFKISLRTQQAGFPTTGLSINVPKMENLSSLASPKRAKLRWSSLAFAAPFLIYRHKVSYRCSLPSPLQKRSKDYKNLSLWFPKLLGMFTLNSAVILGM